MHPAVSVIFFTTLSGAGFGLMGVLGLGLPLHADAAAWGVCILAFLLATLGLLSSTFHLGHPERAWRAFSQWRSSWLSREGLLAILALALFAAYSWLWLVRGERHAALGAMVSVASVLTVFATAMIYAQLRTVPHWHTPLTPACYLLFSLASGTLLFLAFHEAATTIQLVAGLVTLAVSWGLKLAWWSRAAKATLVAGGSDTGSATGLGKLGKVRLLERPHTGPNYLTREMVHTIARRHARTLRRISLLFGLVLPALCVVLTWGAGLPPSILFVAFGSLTVGLLAERWLFFAEATHSVSLYY